MTKERLEEQTRKVVELLKAALEGRRLEEDKVEFELRQLRRARKLRAASLGSIERRARKRDAGQIEEVLNAQAS